MDSIRSIRFPAIVTLLFIAVLISSLIVPAGQSARAATGWQAENSGVTTNLCSASAANAKVAWAVGSGGTILNTSDGGQNWVSQDSDVTDDLTCVSAVDEETAWAVGGSNAIKTTDGGATWAHVPSIETAGAGGLYRVDAVDSNTAWFCFNWDSAGVTNAGVASVVNGDQVSYLKPDFAPGSSATDLYAVNASTVWVTENSVVSLTINGGGVWAPFVVGNYNIAISAVDASTAWMVDVIRKTTNAGFTWTQQTSGVNKLLLDICAVDKSYAWAVGEGGAITKTASGGTTWSPQVSGTKSALRSVSAVDPNNAWVVGDGGVVLHTTDGGAGAPVPYVKSMSPVEGIVGDAVTFKGSGFGATRGSSYVAFGSVAATQYTSWSDSQIVCKVPSMSPAVVQAKVTTGYGTSRGLSFEVLPTPTSPFCITRVKPASGTNVSSVKMDIAGAGFQAGATAQLQQGSAVINATGVTVVSATKITCTLSLSGAATGKYDVVVHNPDGKEATLTGGFTVTNACGQSAGISVLLLAGLMGLLSAAGLSRRRK